MTKCFITYGDIKFKETKNRILAEAKNLGWFDLVKGFGPEDVSQELRETGLMSIDRGGGLWSWKPDIILNAMEELEDGDILVYADSGCSLQPCKEWAWIEKTLKEYDIIAQRIYQQTAKWTRKEIIDYFEGNREGWLDAPQHCATVILKKSEFSKKFIEEWRDMILTHPLFIMDVDKEKNTQHPAFYENRHDQSVYNALIYKYIDNGKILSIWERIEDYDPINLQAIRATRLRDGSSETPYQKMKGTIKRLIKKNIYPLKWNKYILDSCKPKL